MMWRFIAVLAFFLGLSACANLSAVSDFAKLSSEATANATAIDGYPEATQEIARMAPPAKKAVREQQAKAAPDETKVADLGMKTLSLYFLTLSKLADDKTVDVKDSATSIGTSLKTLSAIKSSIADPATALITFLLTAPLDAYRRKAVANLIDGANIPVQRLCSDLAAFAGSVAALYDSASLEADIFYSGLHSRSADPAAREAVEEWHQTHLARYNKQRDQALAAQATFRKIEQAQADLQAHKSDLSGAELKGLLARYSDQIFKASNLLGVHS